MKMQVTQKNITNNVTNDRSATCCYCPKNQSCESPAEMETHLANICLNISKNIKEYLARITFKL